MRVPGALLVVLAAASARAGDPPAPASDSIEAAKRDLASIKAPASPSEPGPGTPGIGAKDDGPVPGAARVDAPSKMREPTADWLLDAMGQKSEQPQSSRAKDDLTQGDVGFLGDADREDARGERDARLAGASEKAASKAPAESIYNPLDAFMGSWISAQDRELLVPAARGVNPMGPDRARAAAEALPGIDLGQHGASAASALATHEAGPAELRTAANPYISDLALAPVAPTKSFSAPDLLVIPPIVAPDLPRAMSPAGIDPKSLDNPRSSIPDFAQPTDNDRYFKEMKRF